MNLLLEILSSSAAIKACYFSPSSPPSCFVLFLLNLMAFKKIKNLDQQSHFILRDRFLELGQLFNQVSQDLVHLAIR